MTITIPDTLLDSARMSESELRQEIALMLYEREGEDHAGMDRLHFQHLLASRGGTIHYGLEDFEQDLGTLRGLGACAAEN